MAIAAKKKRKTVAGRKKAPAARRPAAGSKKAGAAGKPRAGKNADDAPERSAPPMAEVDSEALEFIEAIDRFKRQHGRPFPSWSEVLMVLRELGYRRG
jgi:hypothetical protein